MDAGHDAVAVEVDPKHISKILFSETGHNTIFDVDLGDKSPVKAMIVDWQREPIKDKLIHIDLKRIAMDKLLKVSVRVKLMGVPVGVKTRAASWTRCCAKWRSSACRPTFPTTSTWM